MYTPGYSRGVNVPRVASVPMSARSFVREHTKLRAVPFAPEIRLHLADEPLSLWEETERHLGLTGLPPPFWAFAWAGGQALARYVLDHPGIVAGQRVLDVASGSGLVAVAAAMAGAATVTAADIDQFAVAAIGLNATANGVTVAAEAADVLGGDGDDAGVVLAGDAFYHQPLADRMVQFLDRARARAALVLIGDPGRAYLPGDRLAARAAYEVPVSTELEDTGIKRVTVWART
jgi:predicted nicotinamide N-methyase